MKIENLKRSLLKNLSIARAREILNNNIISLEQKWTLFIDALGIDAHGGYRRGDIFELYWW